MPPLALASRAAPVCSPAADNAPATLRHSQPRHPPPATPSPRPLPACGAQLLTGATTACAPPRPRPGSEPPFSVRRYRGPLRADWLGSISGDRSGRRTGILLHPASRASPARAPWLRAPGTTFCNLTPSSRVHSPSPFPRIWVSPSQVNVD